MAAVCYLIAVLLFGLATFGGAVGSLNLVPLGLMFVALGLLVGAAFVLVSGVRGRP